jgi:hypothetical protein
MLSQQKYHTQVCVGSFKLKVLDNYSIYTAGNLQPLFTLLAEVKQA